MKVLVGNPPILVNVFIPREASKIAVLVSGGSDSAVLLYMLALDAKRWGVEILPFTVPRPDGAINYSPGIVECVSRLSGVELPSPVSIGNPDNHHSQQTRSGHTEIVEKYPDLVWTDKYGYKNLQYELLVSVGISALIENQKRVEVLNNFLKDLSTKIGG
jgi:hypothetical protein